MGTEKRRLREKENRISEIRAAAKKVFQEKGYKHATIDDIAGEAEVSKGTIYLYFKTKDDLYISLMMSALDELGRRLEFLQEELLKEKYRSGHEFFEDLSNVYWGVYEHDPGAIRIVQVFYQGEPFFDLSEEALKTFNQRAKINFETGRKVIKIAVQMGLLNEVDPVKLIDLLWAAFIGVIQLEETKFRVTKKDHIYATFKFSFSLFEQCLVK